MTLRREPAQWPSAFDYIECPVCGSADWVQLPFDGVYCESCNCAATLRPTCGDQGFVVDFDASYCHSETPSESLIPEHSSAGRAAYAKYHGTEDSGYGRAYLVIYAFIDQEIDRDVWVPAWERSPEQASSPA